MLPQSAKVCIIIKLEYRGVQIVFLSSILNPVSYTHLDVYKRQDEQKEIARLRRELRDAQDALDVLKKAINILGK